MAFNLVLTGFIFALVFLNHKIARNKAYPPFIFSLVWGLLVLSYLIIDQFNIIEINTLKTRTIIVVLSGLFSFSLGGLIVILWKQIRTKSFNTPEFHFLHWRIHPLFDLIIHCLAILLSILLLIKAISISGNPFNPEFLLILRVKLNYENASFGLLKYAIPFIFFNGTFRLIWYYRIPDRFGKWRLWSAYLLALLIAILTTGRTNVIFLLLFLVSIVVVQSQITLRIVIRFIVIGYLVFMGMGIFLNKGGSVSNSLGQNFKSMSLSASQYLLGPTAALQKVLYEELNQEYDGVTLRFFKALAFRFNISDIPPPKTQLEFIDVPFKTNVYTLFFHYFTDFGWIGMILIVFILGMVFSEVYVYRYKFWGSYMYGVILYIIILSVFNEQFFTLLSLWIQLLIYSLLTRLIVIKNE